jgi:hypothetical protein
LFDTFVVVVLSGGRMNPKWSVNVVYSLLLLLCLSGAAVVGDRPRRGEGGPGQQSGQWRQRQNEKRLRRANIAKTKSSNSILAAANERARLFLNASTSHLPATVLVATPNSASFSSSSLPMLFYERFTHNPLPMRDNEGQPGVECTFMEATCEIEKIEHSFVRTYVRPQDRVLEVTHLLSA